MRPARLREILTVKHAQDASNACFRRFGFRVLGTLISGFCLPNIHLYQADPRDQRFRSSDSGNQIFLIGRLVSILGLLVRTSIFPEIFRNTHHGKDTFVLDKVCCTKANLLNRTGRFFRYGIEYIFCPRLN